MVHDAENEATSAEIAPYAPVGSSAHLPLSQELRLLLAQLRGQDADTVSIGDLEKGLEDRGFAALMVLLSLPFIQPIPLPGFSIAVGLCFMFQGFRILLGKRAALPGKLRGLKVKIDTLDRILANTAEGFAKIEALFRPRLLGFFKPGFHNLIGVTMISAGIALSLPLPPVILFSNSLPAWSLIFMGFGLMEDDGLLILFGHIVGIATWIYFGFWWEVIHRMLLGVARYFGIEV